MILLIAIFSVDHIYFTYIKSVPSKWASQILRSLWEHFLSPSDNLHSKLYCHHAKKLVKAIYCSSQVSFWWLDWFKGQGREKGDCLGDPQSHWGNIWWGWGGSRQPWWCMSPLHPPVEYSVIHFQKIWNWFGNNVSKKKSPEGTVPKKGNKKPFTIREVIKFTHKAQIYESISKQTEATSGQPEWLKLYPAALTTIIENLTEDELAEAERLAEEWTNDEVPRDVQRAWVSFTTCRWFSNLIYNLEMQKGLWPTKFGHSLMMSNTAQVLRSFSWLHMRNQRVLLPFLSMI